MTFSERRFAPRDPVEAEGYLALGGALLIRCKVVNLSAGGAKLRLLDSTAAPPAIGDLLVGEYGMISRCKVVWSEDGTVGVTFIVPPIGGVAHLGRRAIMPARPPWQSRWLDGLSPDSA